MSRRGGRMMLLAGSIKDREQRQRENNRPFDEQKERDRREQNRGDNRYNRYDNRSYNYDDGNYNGNDRSYNYDGGSYNNDDLMRYERYPTHHVSYPTHHERWNVEENRRRRDSRGRYMERDWMPPNETNHNIGFQGGEMEHGGAETRQLDKRTAERIVRKFRNADGTNGQHWQYDKVEDMLTQYGIKDYDPTEMYIALNMMYSDYCGAAKKLGCNSVELYVELAKAFLDDPDAKDGKLMNYIKSVAED